MTNSPHIRIGFLGTPHFAERVLQLLFNSPFRPDFVVTEPDQPVGRKQIVTPPPTKTAAETLHIPVHQPVSQSELFAVIDSLKPELLIVAAYGRILKPEVFERPRLGTVNVHASLLPKYRGASPIQAAILAGDDLTGVTIMKIDEGLDTGPMIASQELSIRATDTTPVLSKRLADLGGQLLLQILPKYVSGRIEPIAQAETSYPVTKLITKNSGRLTGQETPAEIERMLRAYTPWPGVWCQIDSNRILFHAVHIENEELVIDRLQLAGKQPVDWQTFARDRRELAQKLSRFLPVIYK